MEEISRLWMVALIANYCKYKKYIYAIIGVEASSKYIWLLESLERRLLGLLDFVFGGGWITIFW